VATELEPSRLRRARGLPGEHALASRLELRAGDGLDPLRVSDRIEVLILAGLGGPTIRRILAPARIRELGIERLVLDPRTGAGEVRSWIRKLEFGIVDERVVRERGTYFTLLAAEARRADAQTPPGLPDADVLEAGPILLARRCPLAREYWRRDLARLEEILRRPGSGPAWEAARARRATAQRVLAWFDA
jgi:tRNA (adenine22-N1)-methyltransferase